MTDNFILVSDTDTSDEDSGSTRGSLLYPGNQVVIKRTGDKLWQYYRLQKDVLRYARHKRGYDDTTHYRCNKCPRWFQLNLKQTVVDGELIHVKLRDEDEGGNIFFHKNPDDRNCGINVGIEAWRKSLLDWNVVLQTEIGEARNRQIEEQAIQRQKDIEKELKEIVCFCGDSFIYPIDYVFQVKQSFNPSNMPILKSSLGGDVYYTWTFDDFTISLPELKAHEDVVTHNQYPTFSEDEGVYYSKDGNLIMTTHEMDDKDDIFRQYYLYHMGETLKERKKMRVSKFSSAPDNTTTPTRNIASEWDARYGDAYRQRLRDAGIAEDALDRYIPYWDPNMAGPSTTTTTTQQPRPPSPQPGPSRPFNSLEPRSSIIPAFLEDNGLDPDLLPIIRPPRRRRNDMLVDGGGPTAAQRPRVDIPFRTESSDDDEEEDYEREEDDDDSD